MANNGWSFLGPRMYRPRPNYVALALSLLFAWSVMDDVPAQYPSYMIALAAGTAAWFTYLGVRARAVVSLLFVPVSLLWLNPLLGLDWFNHQGPTFFLAHSAMAILLGIAGYTYVATEKQ